MYLVIVGFTASVFILFEALFDSLVSKLLDRLIAFLRLVFDAISFVVQCFYIVAYLVGAYLIFAIVTCVVVAWRLVEIFVGLFIANVAPRAIYAGMWTSDFLEREFTFDS